MIYSPTNHRWRAYFCSQVPNEFHFFVCNVRKCKIHFATFILLHPLPPFHVGTQWTGVYFTQQCQYLWAVPTDQGNYFLRMGILGCLRYSTTHPKTGSPSGGVKNTLHFCLPIASPPRGYNFLKKKPGPKKAAKSCKEKHKSSLAKRRKTSEIPNSTFLLAVAELGMTNSWKIFVDQRHCQLGRDAMRYIDGQVWQQLGRAGEPSWHHGLVAPPPGVDQLRGRKIWANTPHGSPGWSHPGSNCPPTGSDPGSNGIPKNRNLKNVKKCQSYKKFLPKFVLSSPRRTFLVLFCVPPKPKTWKKRLHRNEFTETKILFMKLMPAACVFSIKFAYTMNSMCVVLSNLSQKS